MEMACGALDLPPLPGTERLRLRLPGLAPAGPGLGEMALGGYAWWAGGAGTAPAALLLHGWGQDAAALRGPAERLCAGGWHAVSLSLRGWRGSGGCDDYGRSGPGDTLAALAWLAARPRVAGLHLLGFSMGGLVALLTAARQPPSLRSVTAVSAPADLRAVYRDTAYHTVRAYYDAVFTPEQWAEASPLEHAARLTLPTRVAVGGRDRMCPPRPARALAEAAPQARLLEFPEMEHEPGEAQWAAIVAAMLEEG